MNGRIYVQNAMFCSENWILLVFQVVSRLHLETLLAAFYFDFTRFKLALVDTEHKAVDCVNEALVNAIVHNDWTISEPLVSFYSDRIEITSHGGIPEK